MSIRQLYPRVATSLSLDRRVVNSEEEFVALGDGWFKTKGEAERALEAQTKPKSKPSK